MQRTWGVFVGKGVKRRSCEADVKDLAPAIGDRIRLRSILDDAKKCRTDNGAAESSSTNLDELQRVDPSVATTRRDGTLRFDLPSSSSSVSSPVIPTQSDWHVTFAILDLQTFSDHVREAVSTGIVTGRVRREIIQVLRTYITAHTVYPKSEQYKTVCRKLLEKFPKLEDTEGKQDYGSWKLSLRNAFKNFRKGYKKAAEGTSQESAPPSKRIRLELDSEDESDMTQEEYEEAVKTLQDEYTKKSGKHKSSSSTVKHLLDKTRRLRLKWVQDERPLISEVIERFPHLKLNRWLRREFHAVVSLEGKVSDLMSTWVQKSSS